MSNKDMPAYPVIAGDEWYTNKTTGNRHPLLPEISGLTKLEAFTKAALQGLCANPEVFNAFENADEYGRIAVNMAEAALAELEGRDG